MVRPLTTQLPDADAIVQVPAPPLAVTTMEVAPATVVLIAIVTCAVPATTTGVAGMAIGVAAADGVDAVESPLVLCPTAVKVLAVPLVRALTVQLPESALMVQVPAPSLAVTTSDVAPATGAATVTATDSFDATAIGVAGTAIGVAASEATEADEAPPRF